MLYAFRFLHISVCSWHIVITGIAQLAFQEMSYYSYTERPHYRYKFRYEKKNDVSKSDKHDG